MLVYVICEDITLTNKDVQIFEQNFEIAWAPIAWTVIIMDSIF